MINVNFEPTPNPQSMKFNISKVICTETYNFKNIQEAERSPLAKKLFGFPWAESIYLGENFLTVTKQDWVDWDIIATPLANLIQEHIESDEPIIVELTQRPAVQDQKIFEETDSPAVQAIKSIIHHEIKPAVAMDGGDIEFARYEDNIVYIHMLGACSGCPSSTMTLKQGVEVRIKEAVPEVIEVVALT
jgi:Fe-S cluster biogenesis protein NfuA